MSHLYRVRIVSGVHASHKVWDNHTFPKAYVITMAAQTLYDKLWQSHLVRQDADGTALIYIDRHLVHEVTSPQAYEGLKVAGRKPWRVQSIVATTDHNTPTQDWDRGIKDPISRLQVETLDQNIKEFGALVYFPFRHERQGIVHVIGPEQGATLPGMTAVSYTHLTLPTIYSV